MQHSLRARLYRLRLAFGIGRGWYLVRDLQTNIQALQTGLTKTGRAV